MEEAALAKPAETHLQGDLGKNLPLVGPRCLGDASCVMQGECRAGVHGVAGLMSSWKVDGQGKTWLSFGSRTLR